MHRLYTIERCAVQGENADSMDDTDGIQRLREMTKESEKEFEAPFSLSYDPKWIRIKIKINGELKGKHKQKITIHPPRIIFPSQRDKR